MAKITNIENVGKLECFCVSTDTGHYELNGLVHHNSVMIQNMILHIIEHRDKIACALIDIKQVEFSNYKNMNGIVGVANTVAEATEILRIGRAVMYKRNIEMAKMGIKNLTDYKPKEKTGKVYVTGRDYDEKDLILCRVDGEEKQVTAGELVEIVNS